ncbi:MAG: 3-deoxy-7-phosphoheptulonate synthase [Candidatus Gastranaerophilales bacterium]|nr:3-deoxy-7-phosphoheptulonate synthase [Candidatus Gastranaerophilales bacterium]
MLIVMKSSASDEQIGYVVKIIKANGFDAHISKGDIHTVIGAVGGRSIDAREFELIDSVEKIIKISSGYKLVSRTFQPNDTVIKIKDIEIGGERLALIAGPCSVESYEQVDATAGALQKIGVRILRGGAFKPRTSPYAFQGLGEEGLKILREVADKYNMIVTSEIMDISQIPLFLKYIDILQVGARNMQNFNLLKELGHLDKPVMLKRGLSATIEEWLMSAEYIMSGGNREIILCERGIRTFEPMTRNTLDISAIPIVKKLSHLPIFTDPSHATGLRDKVAPMSLASISAGCDGLIVEVHHNPECALCDGAQSLYPKQFEELYSQIRAIAPIVKRSL